MMVFAPFAISKQDAQAAKWVGLSPDSPSEKERELYDFLLSPSPSLYVYLSGRNFILKQWHLNYQSSIMNFSSITESNVLVGG
jgi:hypothetical protein